MAQLRTTSLPGGGTDNTIGTINATSDVTVAGASAALTGTTIANAAKVDLTSGSTGVVLDADSWTGVSTIDVGYDVGAAVSYFDGQTYELTLDQTGLDMDLYATGSAQTVTIVVMTTTVQTQLLAPYLLAPSLLTA